MHQIDLPAGGTLRLTATSRPNLGLQRWGMRVFAAGDAAAGAQPRVKFGSLIGGRDCQQRIDVPAQDRDCRIEVTCGPADGDGWQDQQGSVEDDTPGLLVLGYSNPAAPAGRTQDVTLSFAFAAAAGVETPA